MLYSIDRWCQQMLYPIDIWRQKCSVEPKNSCAGSYEIQVGSASPASPFPSTPMLYSTTTTKAQKEMQNIKSKPIIWVNGISGITSATYEYQISLVGFLTTAEVTFLIRVVCNPVNSLFPRIRLLETEQKQTIMFIRLKRPAREGEKHM